MTVWRLNAMSLISYKEPYWGVSKSLKKISILAKNQKRRVVFLYVFSEENVNRLSNPSFGQAVVLFTFY